MNNLNILLASYKRPRPAPIAPSVSTSLAVTTTGSKRSNSDIGNNKDDQTNKREKADITSADPSTNTPVIVDFLILGAQKVSYN